MDHNTPYQPTHVLHVHTNKKKHGKYSKAAIKKIIKPLRLNNQS